MPLEESNALLEGAIGVARYGCLRWFCKIWDQISGEISRPEVSRPPRRDGAGGRNEPSDNFSNSAKKSLIGTRSKSKLSETKLGIAVAIVSAHTRKIQPRATGFGLSSKCPLGESRTLSFDVNQTAKNIVGRSTTCSSESNIPPSQDRLLFFSLAA